MKIVVLAGGLSTERDVSFKTGEMVTKALRENGHQVILLDVFMGYSDKEEDLTGIFDRAEAVSVKVAAIPETAPDLERRRERISRIISSDRMSSSFAGWRTSCLWRFMERTERTVRSRRRLTCLASATQEPDIWAVRLP